MIPDIKSVCVFKQIVLYYHECISIALSLYSFSFHNKKFVQNKE